MGQIRWIGVSGFLLSALLTYRAQGCFSTNNCCHNTEIGHFEKRIQDEFRSAHSEPMSSSKNCQATSEGPSSKRSTSPWEYVEDFDNQRYPQRLWQARCSCHRCVSLASCKAGPGDERLYCQQEPNGNSVAVHHHVLVFYRRPCPGNPERFYLDPRLHPVNVSCTCVAARKRCHVDKGRCSI
uniref:Interleukin-25 n=1 Tax=Pogona vitticeps TaxID=103695 RepID=A0A6J0UZR9_9SAUR